MGRRAARRSAARARAAGPGDVDRRVVHARRPSASQSQSVWGDRPSRVENLSPTPRAARAPTARFDAVRRRQDVEPAERDSPRPRRATACAGVRTVEPVFVGVTLCATTANVLMGGWCVLSLSGKSMHHADAGLFPPPNPGKGARPTVGANRSALHHGPDSGVAWGMGRAAWGRGSPGALSVHVWTRRCLRSGLWRCSSSVSSSSRRTTSCCRPWMGAARQPALHLDLPRPKSGRSRAPGITLDGALRTGSRRAG
jgi:hypothetical protein